MSESTSDNESIDFAVPSAGTYYIRVYFSDAGNTYIFWWNDTVPACNTYIVSGVTEISDVSHEACEILVLGPDFIAAVDKGEWADWIASKPNSNSETHAVRVGNKLYVYGSGPFGDADRYFDVFTRKIKF